MIKNLFIAALVVLSAVAAYGQKSKSKSLTVQYTIDPTSPLPENVVTYDSKITTPISFRDESTVSREEENYDQIIEQLRRHKEEKLNKLRKEYLVISGAKYKASESSPALMISLETSDVKMTYVNDKPIFDLSYEDDVFRYTYSASLTATDQSGNVVWEKVLMTPDNEQSMTKAALFFNAEYKVEMQHHKNNPEKLKELSTRMLDGKSDLVLLQIMEMAKKALADAYEVQTKDFIVGIFTVKGKAFDELNTVSDNIFDTYMKYRALSKKKRLPKESMDQVLRDGIVVWDKYLARKSEMDEKAAKGLLLNCAFAYTWVGDLEKAATYLDQVKEADLNAIDVDDLEDEDDADAPSTLGATVMLSFPSYAINMRKLYEAHKDYQSRLVIIQ